MAKTMCCIQDGIIVNLVNCAADTPETDAFKNADDRAVWIGDTYENGKFYREGTEILTPMEEAMERIEALEAQTADQAAALNAIYQGVTE